MPDISMCPGNDCPMKEKCWRFTATPDPWRQAFFSTPPNDGEECEQFWSNDGRGRDS